MAYLNRKNAPEIELWNVSLLPTIRPAAEAPTRGPAPVGGGSLRAPALLSVSESAAAPLADAA